MHCMPAWSFAEDAFQTARAKTFCVTKWRNEALFCPECLAMLHCTVRSIALKTYQFSKIGVQRKWKTVIIVFCCIFGRANHLDTEETYSPEEMHHLFYCATWYTTMQRDETEGSLWNENSDIESFNETLRELLSLFSFLIHPLALEPLKVRFIFANWRDVFLLIQILLHADFT